MPDIGLAVRLGGWNRMDELLHGQALRLYDVYSELARAFQFRDREQASCQGLSISACHALEILTLRGPLAMSELAGTLFLDNSTVTRLVDRLVGAGLVVRVADLEDGRVNRVHATQAGLELMADIRARLVAEQVAVLEALPAESREAVITAFSLLLAAFRARQACAAPTTCATRGQGGKE